jgi:3-methyl-2-oxobutanoate hydroxymethyltransferase
MKYIEKILPAYIQDKKNHQKPICMLTAYDYPSARLLDQAGIDMILVGDSLAMTVMGHPNTLAVTMDEMIHHCKMVARGTARALLVGDMPFMSYQTGAREAIANAGRFLKEGGMEVVKLEGGRPVANTIRAITDSGICVMGHIGLTPQSLTRLGGYRMQGKSAESAQQLISDALALQEAGCFAVVLESIPDAVAEIITARLYIPTIGIGAGKHCDGQVLVLHDLLGLYHRPAPKFAKQYIDLNKSISAAVKLFSEEVRSGKFPADEHGFKMSPAELEKLTKVK